MRVKLLDLQAKPPTVAHPGEDLGYDLYSLNDVTLSANVVTPVRTGIAIQFDEFWGGIIKDRSSMALKGVRTSAGVIDNGYRGEIVVLLTYHCKEYGNSFSHYDIKAGDKIAQIIPHPCHTWKHICVVSELSESGRGVKGFGSTGK